MVGGVFFAAGALACGFYLGALWQRNGKETSASPTRVSGGEYSPPRDTISPAIAFIWRGMRDAGRAAHQ
jgi:hypothetical protein